MENICILWSFQLLSSFCTVVLMKIRRLLGGPTSGAVEVEAGNR